METKEMFFYNDSLVTSNDQVEDEPREINHKRRFSARRRIEDYMENKELKGYINDFDF